LPNVKKISKEETMDKDKTSRTEHESDIDETFFGGPGHNKTTISDGEHTVEGRGNKSEEAEKTASEKWDKYYGDKK
jgi:hypothetical protein